MSISTWDPNEGVNNEAEIPSAAIERFIALSEADGLDTLAATLSPAEQSEHAGLMQLETQRWQEFAASMSSENIFHLIRFFTMAEEALNGWEANEKSPVIGLNKALRKRGEPLDKNQVMWIKGNSSNRFLPNGPIL